MWWFISGYLLSAIAFYTYITATAKEDPHAEIGEVGLNTPKTGEEELRKAA